MQDSAKYLIHANITANGVVERSDVVGAIFGQTEGLLGDQLDLRELQDSAKVGRIDVEIESEQGQSYGEITIASGLDRVETAILAASLETIDRVGPCRSTIEVRELEDVRQAKRRAVIERAKDLLTTFDESVLSSEELIEEVRRSARVEHITEYEGLPAGPRVAASDAIIVVEGRSDVLRLLEYGVKNAIAVEGTDVPPEVAELSHERTVTAFLDGDRGGDLILKELAQVGAVDYVTFAPSGTSVEDLSRQAVMRALREKVPFEELADAETPHEAATGGETPPEATSDGGAATAPLAAEPSTDDQSGSGPPADDEVAGDDGDGQEEQSSVEATDTVEESEDGTAGDGADDGETTGEEADQTPATDEQSRDRPLTLSDHVAAVIDEASGTVRLLNDCLEPMADAPAADAFDTIAESEEVPRTVLLDGELDQRVLDISAQRGVDRIVARSEGQFVKKPAAVQIETVA
jgi:DNA primase